MINVATVTYNGKAVYEEVRGYDDLNVQPYCFIFQWFEKQESLIIPMHNVECVSTMKEEESNEKTN